MDRCHVWGVEAYVASWIEIKHVGRYRQRVESRLMLPRGLKCNISIYCLGYNGRGLCCLVDWNNSNGNKGVAVGLVEAYVASWIEITEVAGYGNTDRSRLMLPRGLKFLWTALFLHCFRVEAYVASWIEIVISSMPYPSLLSRLMLPRGLKSPCGTLGSRRTGSRLMFPRGLKWNTECRFRQW